MFLNIHSVLYKRHVYYANHCKYSSQSCLLLITPTSVAVLQLLGLLSSKMPVEFQRIASSRTQLCLMLNFGHTRIFALIDHPLLDVWNTITLIPSSHSILTTSEFISLLQMYVFLKTHCVLFHSHSITGCQNSEWTVYFFGWYGILRLCDGGWYNLSKSKYLFYIWHTKLNYFQQIPVGSNINIDARYQSVVQVSGAVLHADVDQSTFDLAPDQYVWLLQNWKGSHVNFPIRCVVKDSPQWGSRKPSPKPGSWVSVTGFLTGIIWNEHDSQVEHFVLELKKVSYLLAKALQVNDISPLSSKSINQYWKWKS